MSFDPPPIPAWQPEWPDFQVWWQQVLGDLKGALTSIQTQIDDLTALNDDDILTPSEKPLWIFMYSSIIAEQAGIDAQATSYGITTEKTAYDTAITDLTAYLATLTVDVDWDDLSGNTDIIGVDFRGYFNDVMLAKQELSDAIAAAAKVLADQAAADAAAAAADAAAAQADADAAQADATEAAREAARIASYPNPGSVLSAADVGTDATITIAGHTRVYPVQGSIDVADVAITGGTITGRPFGTRHYVYYDDTTLADTTPNFLSTTNSATAQVGAAAGRHFVGHVDTPADGGGGTSGQGGGPPGGGGGGGGGAIP